MNNFQEIIYARDYIFDQTDLRPTIGIVLGMEYHISLDFLEQKIVIPTSTIPFFASYFFTNQDKELILGKYAGKSIAILRGRYKYHEGYNLDHITFPIRVFQFLGVKDIILTRVGGAINYKFNPGDFMVVHDHINFTGLNPLLGPNDERLGPEYLDLTRLYNYKLSELAINVSANQSIQMNTGTLAWFTGPSFETPAEVRLLDTIGIDAVASALVPESIVAYHGGMNVLSLVLLTNKAAGITKQPINQSKIVSMVKQQNNKLITFLKAMIERI